MALPWLVSVFKITLVKRKEEKRCLGHHLPGRQEGERENVAETSHCAPPDMDWDMCVSSMARNRALTSIQPVSARAACSSSLDLVLFMTVGGMDEEVLDVLKLASGVKAKS